MVCNLPHFGLQFTHSNVKYPTPLGPALNYFSAFQIVEKTASMARLLLHLIKRRERSRG
jgi:hypothetical protein